MLFYKATFQQPHLQDEALKRKETFETLSRNLCEVWARTTAEVQNQKACKGRHVGQSGAVDPLARAQVQRGESMGEALQVD